MVKHIARAPAEVHSPRPLTKNILKSKFQTSTIFAVVVFINHKFISMFECKSADY